MSTYGYANGSPLVYSDPEGLIAGRIVLGLGMRYVLPRLAARAALRSAQLQAMRHAAGKRLAARVAKRGPKEPPACTKSVTISRARYPESAKHIDDAIASGKPKKLTIDRTNAATNRRESLRGVEPRRGLDRDEYPPAMFKEGGQGSSVRHISPGDNRGAGACMGAQCRGLPNGSRIRIDVVD